MWLGVLWRVLRGLRAFREFFIVGCLYRVSPLEQEMIEELEGLQRSGVAYERIPPEFWNRFDVAMDVLRFAKWTGMYEREEGRGLLIGLYKRVCEEQNNLKIIRKIISTNMSNKINELERRL